MGTEEKTEITNLPEGMSSEELDKLTTEDESDDTGLAEEALAATEDESSPAEESVETDETKKAEEETPAKEEKPEADEKPEVDPKDAVIGGMRRDNRDLRIEKARLEGELEARKSLQTTTEPPPKSPLEIAEAAYIEENGDLDGFAMSGKLYREQKAFDDKQAVDRATTDGQQQVNNTAIQAENELQEGDLSAEQMGQGLDLQTVAGIGTQYLTAGDKLDIANLVKTHGGKAALKTAYKVMVRRTLAASNEDSKLLQNAINIKAGKKSQPKPKKPKGKPDIDALTTEGEDEVKGEAETETRSKRLLDFLGEDGFMEG